MQEVMEHPIVLADGFTYESVAIERWMRGHNTSPMTGKVLEGRRLIPNNTLRSFIRAVASRT